MKFFSAVNKFYLMNLLIVLMLLLSITTMFFVQFTVEDMQDKIAFSDTEIIGTKDKIDILQAEWSYLTRPERLRILAQKYLQDSNYVAVNQVKDMNSLQDYYFAKYQDFTTKQVAEVSF